MGSIELAANFFRATQTEEKIRRENIQGKSQANQTHYEVGKKVRKTIEDLGGTMPEYLPTPTKSIKQIADVMRKVFICLYRRFSRACRYCLALYPCIFCFP